MMQPKTVTDISLSLRGHGMAHLLIRCSDGTIIDDDLPQSDPVVRHLALLLIDGVPPPRPKKPMPALRLVA